MDIEDYEEVLAFHPGYYIGELIDEMEITQEEFAKMLGTTTKTLSELVTGEIRLSDEIAERLSNMLGTSIEMWLNLRTEFERKSIELDNRKKLDEQH